MYDDLSGGAVGEHSPEMQKVAGSIPVVEQIESTVYRYLPLYINVYLQKKITYTNSLRLESDV